MRNYQKKDKLGSSWSCDFETTTDPADARVWAWIAVNMKDNSIRLHGNSMESFLHWLSMKDRTVYFHNLKFDGSYILDYLLKHNWTLNVDGRKLSNQQFNTLISDKGFFYTMTIKHPTGKTTKIIDSLKIINSSVDRIAKGWHLPISKLKIDYDEYREPGHILTIQEKEYIINDATIVAIALKSVLDQGMTKITAGSNAFAYYINEICGGRKNFRRTFPCSGKRRIYTQIVSRRLVLY